jgi:hypothetical protein
MMKDQLQLVKHQLNVLSGASIAPAVPMATPVRLSPRISLQQQHQLFGPASIAGGASTAQPMIHIERMLVDISGKLAYVDQLAERTANTEKTLRELQVCDVTATDAQFEKGPRDSVP